MYQYAFFLAFKREDLRAVDNMANPAIETKAVTIGFASGEYRDGKLIGGGQEYIRTEEVTGITNLSVWTNAEYSDHIYVNLSSLIQVLPPDRAVLIADEFNKQYRKYGYGIGNLGGEFRLVRIEAYNDNSIERMIRESLG